MNRLPSDDPSRTSGTPQPLGAPESRMEAHQRERRRGRIEVLLGLALIAGGVLASILSYSEAKPGDPYSVLWGLVFVGLVAVIRGATRFGGTSAVATSNTAGPATRPLVSGGHPSTSGGSSRSASIAAWAISGFLLVALGSAIAVLSAFQFTADLPYDPSRPIYEDQSAPSYAWIAGIAVGGVLVVGGLIAALVATIAKGIRVARANSRLEF